MGIIGVELLIFGFSFLFGGGSYIVLLIVGIVFLSFSIYYMTTLGSRSNKQIGKKGLIILLVVALIPLIVFFLILPNLAN